MNQELSFETIPFELSPEIQGEIFEEENERGGRRPSAGGASRSFRPSSQPGLRPKGTKRPPIARPRPIPRGRRGPWGVVPEPYGIVSKPYSSEPEPSGSERVRWLQDCLNQAIGTQLPVTGMMGPETRSAVRSFQRQQGLRTTGIAGPDTEEALKTACAGRNAEENTELESPPVKAPGLIARLTWQPSNEAAKLYAWDEVQQRPFDRIHGDVGVYIAVLFDRESVRGKYKKIIKRILKVGKASRQSFRERLNDAEHKELQKLYPGRVGYYLAKIQATNACPAAGCAELVEHLIARTLIRAGKRMLPHHGKPIAPVKPIDQIQVANILPRPLAGNLDKAYTATGPIDVRKQKIGLVTRLPASEPSSLILPRDAIWELGESLDPETYNEIMSESPFSEAEEIELAAELLSISSEEELDQFLGKMFKGIGRGLKKVGRFIGKRVLPVLGKGLKALGKAALPIVGKALGSFIPIPGVGTMIGGALGTALSKALELEFSGLPPEEAEFEMARRFIRIAATAARQTALSSPDLDEETIVNEALLMAARKHLPHFYLSKSERFGMPKAMQQGRWIRHGDQIGVLGV